MTYSFGFLSPSVCTFASLVAYLAAFSYAFFFYFYSLFCSFLDIFG